MLTHVFYELLAVYITHYLLNPLLTIVPKFIFIYKSFKFNIFHCTDKNQADEVPQKGLQHPKYDLRQ